MQFILGAIINLVFILIYYEKNLFNLLCYGRSFNCMFYC